MMFVYITTLPPCSRAAAICYQMNASTRSTYSYACGPQLMLPTSGRYTWYWMLVRMVGARNILISSWVCWMCWNKRSSNMGGNMAVSNTSWVWVVISRPSRCIAGQKSVRLGSITWYLLMIIWSSCCTNRSRFKNNWKSGVTVDLGVTSMMDALLGGRRLSYTTYKMPSCWYYHWKSCRSASSGMTTTVVPPGSTYAGSMKSMLFLPPIGMTATTGLSPSWMVRSAGPCTPRSWMSFCTMRWVAAAISAC